MEIIYTGVECSRNGGWVGGVGWYVDIVFSLDFGPRWVAVTV